MAWNKSIQSSPNIKTIPIGAPIATNPGKVGKPYKDTWDTKRAYTEGMAKIVWVFRAIDAIAGNQAKLPISMTKGDRTGEIVKSHPILDLLNSKTNDGETSFAFRYRISAQLMLSRQGVFVELIKGKDGKLNAMHLLPPEHTFPIPDARKFVSGYKIELPNYEKTLAPENVLWIRRPHPLDPYLSLTPMEAAGMAIEVEYLAKLYNRNFLLNDGRPGGLIVVRNELEPADKRELEARFRGDISRVGTVSVISADQGADFVDMAVSPRDAAYVEMRQISKEEILASFGVPESIIGNASGRTFDNAAEEGRIFWMETMETHLDLLARSWDALDEDHSVFHDTSGIPILILAKQEREKHLLEEWSGGLISANEYRDGTGRKKVDSELSDALLANPQLTPIGNTEKAMPAPGMQAPGAPGSTPGAPLPVQNGEVPVAGEGDFADQGSTPAGGAPASPAAPAEQPVSAFADDPAAPVSQLSAENGIEVKDAQWGSDDEWLTKAAQDTDRWEEILGLTLERFFERQQRVISEKLFGAKARKALAAKNLSVDQVFDSEVWNRQLVDDIRPTLAAIMSEGAMLTEEKMAWKADVASDEELQKILETQVGRIQNINNTTKADIAAGIATASALETEKERDALLKAVLGAVFLKATTTRKERIAEIETQSSYNASVYVSGLKAGARQKTWLTRRDDRVRSAHRTLHGKSVGIDDGFSTENATLRFPGDPTAPANLSLGCRCTLRLS